MNKFNKLYVYHNPKKKKTLINITQPKQEVTQ